MSSLPYKKVLVVGLGKQGRAAAAALVRHKLEVTGWDQNPATEASDLESAGVGMRTGEADPKLLDGMDLVVKGPGVPHSQTLVMEAKERGIPIWSELEVAYRLLPNLFIAITGTNGKTTTTELIGHIFEVARKSAQVVGNIGEAVSGLVGEDLDPNEWLITEVSSYQLDDIHEFRARVAVLTNVTPDHLDRYPNFEAYKTAKLRVFENQTAEDFAVVPKGFGPVPGEGKRIEFSADEELPELQLEGRHNRENAAAAAAVGRAVGISGEAIAQALGSFKGAEHRIERVREVDGVVYVNDSKGTNPDATERAIETYPGCRLIAGGSRKETPYDHLAQVAKQEGVKKAYLIGETAEEMGSDFQKVGIPVSQSGVLERAVAEASGEAEAGETVLFSPACASFDQFANYEERGKRFKELVGAL